ncbi:MAG: GNAT family N-acetyltransferase [Flavobacteriaceae bacterium]
MTVREATKEDMPQVLELIKELAIFEKEPDAVEVTLQELELAGFGPNPEFTCFVAQMNHEIVGMALVYFRFSTWVGKTVHLEDLIVKEALRGKGVGTALYRRVMEYAQQQGVKRVNWMVLGWNKEAIAFYEKTGAKVLDEWWQVEMSQSHYEKFLKK